MKPSPPTRVPAAPSQEFELLEEMGATILDASTALAAVLDGRTRIDEAWQTIRDLEHKGDAVARDIFELLLQPRKATLDPDALKTLIVLESAQELREALRLRQLRDVFPHTRTMHRLENRGDDVLREGIEHLFAGRLAAKDVVKWKDILEILEASTDRCEDVANVLETLVIQAGGQETLAAGSVAMDVDRHEVTVAGNPVPLSSKEFDLLHLLLRHQGKVVRRERLLNEVWGEDYYGDTRTLDTHVGWLRKKVEGAGSVRIVAVRGLGYRLDLKD